MELIQVTTEMYKISKRMEKFSEAIHKLAQDKAIADRDYRVELAQEMLRLKADGMAAGLIRDIAVGNVADFYMEKERTEAFFKAAIESVDALKSQLSALQTILKYQTEV